MVAREKKNDSSCFVEEDDEDLQNLKTNATQHVVHNENTFVNTLLCFILEEYLNELSLDERNEKDIVPETIANCKKLVHGYQEVCQESCKKSNRQYFSLRQMRIVFLSMYINSLKGFPAIQTASLLPYPSI